MRFAIYVSNTNDRRVLWTSNRKGPRTGADLEQDTHLKFVRQGLRSMYGGLKRNAGFVHIPGGVVDMSYNLMSVSPFEEAVHS